MTRTLSRTAGALALFVTLSVPAAAQVIGGGLPRPVAAEDTAVTGTAVIKGRVVAADSGRPLRRAQVRLEAPERKAKQPVTIGTDLQGYFEATELPAGRYTVSVTRAGYLPMQHGQRHADERGSPVQLMDGQELTLKFALPRAGRIVGRVMDELGEPVAAIPVHILRQEYFHGRRQLVPAPLAGPAGRTDESGLFRTSGIPPGTYYLMASSSETWASEDDPNVTFGHAATYYPGVRSAATAQPIVIAPGQTIDGLEFSLVPVRAVTVSGTALDPDGLPLAGASVSLMRELQGPSAASMMSAGQAPVAADGSWTLKTVPPGEYTLRVTGRSAGGRQEAGHLAITVDEADVEGVVLLSDPGAVVAGEVVVEHGAPLPPSLRVMMTAEEGARVGSFLAAGFEDGLVDEHGRFARRGASGPMLVNVVGLPPGWSVRSVDAGGEDYAETPLTLARGERRDGLRILLTTRFPSLTGMVTDDRGNSADATVLLFPTDETKWFESQATRRVTRSDQSGTYRFATVRPGEYLAVALEILQAGQSRDPEFLETLRGRATTVRLQEGENRTLNLRVQR
jgi:hypothetical protein